MNDADKKGRPCKVFIWTEPDETEKGIDVLPGLAGEHLGMHESRKR